MPEPRSGKRATTLISHWKPYSQVTPTAWQPDRFWKDNAPFSIAKAPHGFDKQAFAIEHGCDPDMLHLYADSSGSYVWVQDEATGLHLMQGWANGVDAFFGAGMSPIN